MAAQKGAAVVATLELLLFLDQFEVDRDRTSSAVSRHGREHGFFSS
jgi:hypothetical protein